MDKFLFLIVLIGCTLFFACTSEKPEQLIEKQRNFELKNSVHTGITFSNDLKNTAALNIIEYLYFYNGGGVAVGDVNNDGLEDLFFTANQKKDELYINQGNLQFENHTQIAGITDTSGWSTGVSMDDINGDGHLDIYICKVSMFPTMGASHNLLYINDGTGKFTEQSKAYGLDFSGYSTQSCFLDYDKDGDLDMYLLNHAVHSVRSYGDIKKRQLKDDVSGDRFYENRINEIGKFVDVTEEVGIYNSPLGYGLAISAADINNDGWVDLYVGNDFHENDYLYINNGGKTFTESIAQYFTSTSQFSMGVDIADMNNDALEDIFTVDMMPYDEEVVLKSGGEDTDQIKRIKKDLGFEIQNARNHFQLNEQDKFIDIAYQTKTFASDWSWSVLLQDFNNDRHNDIFITNGIVGRPNDLDYINYINAATEDQSTSRLIEKMPSQPLRNLLFTRKGNLIYDNLEDAFLGPPSFSNGAAYGDLDNDGDLDLVINNINEKAFVLENNASTDGNFISLILSDKKDNVTAKGAKVSLTFSDEVITKTYQTTRGFLSSSSHRLHFGLGQVELIDQIKITWPDGKVQLMEKIAVNQELNIVKPNELEEKNEIPEKPVDLYAVDVLKYKHEENNFYDEDFEKLIPERISYEGPALICEDLNGDNIKDIFIGGGRNQESKLLLGTKSGTYNNKPIVDFKKDAKYEDIAAATIDFDKDGDLDIYIVSGGNDNNELDKLLEDRIYLNNGGGNFKRIPLSLPHTNGSAIAVADFDADGYEDIFIGASTIPGSYGLSPYSFLLKNLNGQGVDIAMKQRFGMVKDSKWADIDGDGDQDLAICGDWMNIRVFQNDAGKLIEKTKDYQLDSTYGFWNTLEFVDMNKDGQLDMLAGNAGINSKWSASKEQPIKLYVGDFDENGATDPIIFYAYFNKYIPLAGLDKLTSQLPFLKKAFTSYESFKTVSDIDDLIQNATEKIVETKKVTELRSMVYIQKEGKFIGVPLNKEEQWASINDFEMNDNGNILYVGNNNGYVAEFGMVNSNPGKMLGNFNQEQNTFQQSKILPLPKDLNGRKISNLGNNKILILGNNDYPYILSKRLE